MKEASAPVSIHILDKEYRVACEPQERDELLAAARFLDEKMREIRDGGKVIGVDRIAVMAALNIAHELLGLRGEKDGYVQTISAKLRLLQEKIGGALHQGKQMEL